MRRRIQRQTIDERLVNKYKEVLGMNTKEAWGRVRLVTLQSDLKFIGNE